VIAPAASSTTIIALANCSANRIHTGFTPRAASSFGPWMARRAAASTDVRPRDGSDASDAATSVARIAHGRIAFPVSVTSSSTRTAPFLADRVWAGTKGGHEPNGPVDRQNRERA